MTWSQELSWARAATTAAASCLKHMAQGTRTVLNDSGRDIKMQADIDAERIFLELLAPSGYPILSEESGARGDVAGDGPVWVVDPLDGTMNFSRAIPFYSTSIALLVNGDPVLGVVHDVGREETFYGVVGQGCWLNDVPITVSSVAEPSSAILATGLPTYRDFDAAALSDFSKELGRFKKVRMLGSAALMLAYVAGGRVDAYWEDDIMLWDVAAGLALVRAAGGCVSLSPSPRHPWSRYVRCAGNEALWRE